MKTRIAVVTNVVPSYRLEFYERLIAELGDDLTIYCQRAIPGMSLKVCHELFSENVHLVKSCSLLRETIAWQWLPIAKMWRGHDVYFFTGNPRVLSTVIIATLFRLCGKRVIIWGQLHTFGANAVMEKIRLRWWRQFRYLFVYTDAETEQAHRNGFTRHQVIGMNNGLNQQRINHEKQRWSAVDLTAWQRQEKVADQRIVLSCTRLEKKNNFPLMMDAMPALLKQYPDLLWVIIGDGGEREYLQQRARECNLSSRIRWLGALHEESLLAPWFLSASVLVHPSAIGLTLLHAYGYGLPVITHCNSHRHGPEIAAMPASNRNFCFQQDNVDDLIAKLTSLLDNHTARHELAQEVFAVTTLYNVDIMAKRFLKMVSICTGSPSSNLCSSMDGISARQSEDT